MNKIWKFKESKSNKLILIKDSIIYKGNPNEQDLNRVNLETNDLDFLKKLFSIPYSYIKRIENQKGKKCIKIFFGKESEEEINVENEIIKNEIFEFLKAENSKLKYSAKTPNILNYIKAQLLALLTLTGIFIWSLYLAFEIENGVQYELVGNGRPSIAGIVLIIANFGHVRIIIGYIILLSLNIYAITKRLKSRSETEILER